MIGVVVMAYGGPDRLDDVEPYLLDVRAGRATPAEVVEEVRERYREIGGRSPILEQTRGQSAAIQDALDQVCAGQFRCYTAMRHWHPFIPAAVEQMRAERIERIVGLVMAPHYSDLSIGAYERKLRESAGGIGIAMIRSWALLPGYLDAMERNVRVALAQLPAGPATRVLFTAHSLPQRILASGDPYKEELLATVEALRPRFPGVPCDFAFQSAAMTAEPWLGPDAGDVLRDWRAHGVAQAVVCAIGFVTEHVEILYDLDIELQHTARDLGVTLVRARMLGVDSAAMEQLADLIVATARAEGWLGA